MGKLPNLEAPPALILPKIEVQDTNLWTEELERLPLKQRLKILLGRGKCSDLFPDSGSEKDEVSNFSMVAKNDFASTDDGKSDSEGFPAGCSLLKGKTGSCSSEENRTGKWRDCNYRVSEANVVSPGTVPVGEMNSFVSPPSAGMDILGVGNSSSTLAGNCPFGGNLLQKENENQKSTDYIDELDHIVLKERQRLLLSSQLLIATKTSFEVEPGQLPTPAVDSVSQKSPKSIKEEISYDDEEIRMVENHVCGTQTASFSSSSNAVITALPYSDHKSSCLGDYYHGRNSSKSGNMTRIEEKDSALSPTNLTRFSTGIGGNSLSNQSAVPKLSSNYVNVKVELLDVNNTSIPKVCVAPLTAENIYPVKIECGSRNDFVEDIFDHMLLRERMKLLPSYVPCFNVHGMECTGKTVPSAVGCEPIAKESPEPLIINQPRKRRKTATDSVETALEEDAPGLLQVLIQKGVSVSEIKLYGQTDDDVSLDDLPIEDNFTELEAIISKIFSQQSMLLKLSSVRFMKGERVSYCLACLFSLVEQAQYLQFRKWPVEWGWCRDLQAFIFVFARHNRIVLERPEYGYATYFFELMDSLPIKWQIKRLVTAMKLTTCSRATLIENKALVVGEDLSEGEAKVLIEYGWIPNTGLGTMLNYCDRVYHDRKSENPAEWRSKIGKALIDGYNGGCIVATDVSKKVEDYNFSENPQIKVETN